MSIDTRRSRLQPIKYFTLSAAFLSAFCLPLLLAAQQTSHAPNGIGFVASGEASSQEVGLAFYPGARLQKDDAQDSSAANFGLWGGGSGMKFVVVKLESGDSPDKIAAFYRRALARYGTVLDCSHATGKQAHVGDDTPVTCDEEPPQNGAMVFKAGTEQSQHIVAIEVKGGKVLIQLVNISAWKHGDDH
jgi:hypothetical protein